MRKILLLVTNVKMFFNLHRTLLNLLLFRSHRVSNTLLSVNVVDKQMLGHLYGHQNKASIILRLAMLFAH